MQGRLASGEDVFGPLLRNFLLENKHRVSVEMLPDTGLAAQKEAVERERLAAVRAAMGPEDVEAVIRETKELKERQVGLLPLRHPSTLSLLLVIPWKWLLLISLSLNVPEWTPEDMLV